MKLQCNGQQLRSAIMQAQLVTTKHAGLPVLSSVLLNITKEGGVVRGTNLSLGVESRFAAKVEKEGQAAIDGGLLVDVLGSLDSDDLVSIEQDGSVITVSAPNSESTIKTINHEDFPTLPKIDTNQQFSLPIEDCVEAIKSVMYAASPSDVKPEISSVYMYKDNDELVLVSTDSFRLAEKKISVPNLPDINGIMIPVKNIAILVRILAEQGGHVDISVSDTQVVFTTPHTYCVSRLVDGQYPDYRQIIPQDFNSTATVLKQDLASALKVLSIFSDKFNQVDMDLSVSNKRCSMTSQNTDKGQNTTQLECAIEGDDIQTRFNARYVQDCLPYIQSDSVVVSLIASNKPMVIKGVGQHDFVYLVMPMNR